MGVGGRSELLALGMVDGAAGGAVNHRPAVNAREVVAVSGATIRQIAEAMGVGIATVHRAVSGDVPNGTDQQPDDLLEDAGENSLSPDPVNQAVRQV